MRPYKRRRYHRPPAGSAPGTLTPAPDAEPTSVSGFIYSAESCVRLDAPSLDTLHERKSQEEVVWVNANGHANIDLLRSLADLFGIHPLALEDVVHLGQRAKTEHFDGMLYVVVHMLEKCAPLCTEQVSLFLGPDWVFTVQERKGDCLEPVRERLAQDGGRLRTRGADYLAYAIVDAIVDAGFPVAEGYGDLLDELEESILERPGHNPLLSLQRVRRDLAAMRRVMWPLRDALATLAREESGLIEERTTAYFRDAHDHAIRLVDIVESEREMAAGLMDAYMSVVSNRMNEVMKVLTVIATIFIPLGFIAGVYGMNFDPSSPANMPELRWPLGYPYALGLMALTALVMVAYFRRKGWI